MQRYRMEANAILRDTGLPNTSSSCGAQVDVYARPSETGSWVRAEVALLVEADRDGGLVRIHDLERVAAEYGWRGVGLCDWLEQKLDIAGDLVSVQSLAKGHGWDPSKHGFIGWIGSRLKSQADAIAVHATVAAERKAHADVIDELGQVTAERDELASLAHSQLGAAVSLVVLAKEMGWNRDSEPSLDEWLRARMDELKDARERLELGRQTLYGKKEGE